MDIRAALAHWSILDMLKVKLAAGTMSGRLLNLVVTAYYKWGCSIEKFDEFLLFIRLKI